MNAAAWSLEVPDGARLYGVTHQASKTPSEKVVDRDVARRPDSHPLGRGVCFPQKNVG